jgi:hypothetical protein
MPTNCMKGAKTTLACTSARAQLRRMRRSRSHTRHHRTGQRQAGMGFLLHKQGLSFQAWASVITRLEVRNKRNYTKFLSFSSLWGTEGKRLHSFPKMLITVIYIFYIFSFSFFTKKSKKLKIKQPWTLDYTLQTMQFYLFILLLLLLLLLLF